MTDIATSRTGEDPDVVARIRTGSELQFAELIEPHRRELRVHCYRMLANLDDAEDATQETFIKAWRSRTGFEGRSTMRAWLYRIATNACLDAVRRKRRRVVVADPAGSRPPSFDDVLWLQPIPDSVLDDPVPIDAQPDALVVANETIALAYLAAIQHLAPRPRAVLILRDVLGWSANETAAALELSVAAANSALQRARARLRELGPPDDSGWADTTPPTDDERALLERYMDAHARADAESIVAMLADDVLFTMPTLLADPGEPTRYDGRAEVAAFFRNLFGARNPGDWRLVSTRANRQIAAANYVRPWDAREFRAITLDVLRVVDGAVVEITTFDSSVFASFGLPDVL